MELIFAIALPAFASAFIFNVGASSGGTDIIAMILSKYSSVGEIIRKFEKINSDRHHGNA